MPFYLLGGFATLAACIIFVLGMGRRAERIYPELNDATGRWRSCMRGAHREGFAFERQVAAENLREVVRTKRRAAFWLRLAGRKATS